MRQALVLQGGWPGHQPREFAEFARGQLTERGFEVEVHDSLAVLDDGDRVAEFDLIVPVWTMGELTDQQERNLLSAVAAGTGLAGWHGGMGDAFRPNLGYKMMVGGQFVAHPGDFRRYEVRFTRTTDPITKGLEAFDITSEQYFLHVQPGLAVLAETTFSGDDMPWLEGVVMPVAWKRSWGEGRVFYLALGHRIEEFDIPEVRALATRGMIWASRPP